MLMEIMNHLIADGPLLKNRVIIQGDFVGRKANEYQRVTEVISFIDSAWFKYWVKSVGLEEADRISLESTTFGKGVHSIAENYLLKTTIEAEFSERQKTCGSLITKWIDEAKVKPLLIGEEKKPAIELDLKSEKYKLTGHPDLINTFGDSPINWVCDWKTSKKCSRGYILQLAAYAKMIEEQYGIEVNDGAIIRTPSDPNLIPQFETHEFHNLKEKYWPVFEECLDIVQFFKSKGKWSKNGC